MSTWNVRPLKKEFCSALSQSVFCWDSLWQQPVSILLGVGQGDRQNRFQILFITQCEDLEAILSSKGISLYFSVSMFHLNLPRNDFRCPSTHREERTLPLLTTLFKVSRIADSAQIRISEIGIRMGITLSLTIKLLFYS